MAKIANTTNLDDCGGGGGLINEGRATLGNISVVRRTTTNKETGKPAVYDDGKVAEPTTRVKVWFTPTEGEPFWEEYSVGAVLVPCDADGNEVEEGQYLGDPDETRDKPRTVDPRCAYYKLLLSLVNAGGTVVSVEHPAANLDGIDVDFANVKTKGRHLAITAIHDGTSTAAPAGPDTSGDKAIYDAIVAAHKGATVKMSQLMTSIARNEVQGLDPQTALQRVNDRAFITAGPWKVEDDGSITIAA